MPDIINSLFSIFSPKHTVPLQSYPQNEAQRRVYASEKLDNFRWLAKLFAKCSNLKLSNDALVSETTSKEVAEHGQFAEIVYSDVPIEVLLKNFVSLNQSGYPLEHYHALGDCELIESIRGTAGDLPAFIFFRPLARQLVVSISGSASFFHALYDLWVLMEKHPSGHGSVHTGFLVLYHGLKVKLIEGIRKEINRRCPIELILVGHSMGGSLAYLLLLDLLAEELSLTDRSTLSTLKLRIATYGAPRTADQQLVDYFHSLIQQYRKKFNLDETFFAEYAIQGYNDGVPALPPSGWGYHHFCRAPLYTAGGKLYRPPAPNDSQAMFFQTEDEMRIFPMGGHNYYNGRDLELFRRRTGWLAAAEIEKPGWESRYEALARRDSS